MQRRSSGTFSTSLRHASCAAIAYPKRCQRSTEILNSKYIKLLSGGLRCCPELKEVHITCSQQCCKTPQANEASTTRLQWSRPQTWTSQSNACNVPAMRPEEQRTMKGRFRTDFAHSTLHSSTLNRQQTGPVPPLLGVNLALGVGHVRQWAASILGSPCTSVELRIPERQRAISRQVGRLC